MAVLPCKRLVLVAFILLCFFSNTARSARSLGVVSKGEDQKGYDDNSTTTNFRPKEDGVRESDAFLHMDYTPARKKPPIHN
ncbi:hypothetical protein FEM48_Zijuj08G0179800 [Ziziphus jujuba var. spinosa]|uniref:Root meristem growth factor 9-like n=1 Tax=Ziziphus jujuba var. spinosa TaxID=714518 RepID=A0A978V0J6_ZIZJJ|nr:hypothetical protein FEM48_Zijuj08G0179800 [Ziziphus jujuba var. spinosa]